MEVGVTYRALVGFGQVGQKGFMHDATEDFWFIADTYYQRNRMVSLTVEQAFERINAHLHTLSCRNMLHKPIAYALLNLKSNLVHGRRR